MIRYTGKICPYCKKKFTVNDCIVICSSCEMPHHKECWIANEGCTTFACQGTIQYPNASNDSVLSDELFFDEEIAEESFCSYCGAEIPVSSIFCPYCGGKLR